jgi:hypothetical protein
VEGLGGRDDRQHPGVGDPAEVLEGFPHLPLLDRTLLGVFQVLEPAPPALGDVGAGGGHSPGSAFEDRFQPSLGILTSHACESDLDAIAGQSAIQEDHAPFVTRERLTSENEVGDRQGLQLVDFHGSKVRAKRVCEENWEPAGGAARSKREQAPAG